jgi:ABC-2 type transport system permease protein
MTGLIPWTFFNESMMEGASSVIVNGDLTRKIYFPRDVLAISKVTSKFVSFLLSLIVVFLFLILSGWGIKVQYLIYMPIIMIIEYILCLGFALFFSAITVYFRDMEYIVGVIMMAWVWGTPIMYDANIIQNAYIKLLINLNPMTGIINSYHNVLYHQHAPSMQQLGISFIAAIIILIVGEFIFIKLEANFAEEL